MKHTVATKRRMSKLHSGKGNPFYGKKHTPEAREKMALALARTDRTKQFRLAPMSLKTMSDVDLAYVAGIVDGEGSIRFSRDRPYIAVYGSHKGLMHALVSCVGGNVQWNADRRGRVPGHVWRINAARDVYALCDRLWPFLIVKRKEAYDVMKFLKQKYGARLDG